MKIVTMCQGGHVRSVCAKHILTYRYGHDVVACGWESNSPETRKMLFDWSDYIVVMQPNMMVMVPLEYHKRTFCYDVGQDSFLNPFHPDLQRLVIAHIEQHGLFNKR